MRHPATRSKTALKRPEYRSALAAKQTAEPTLGAVARLTHLGHRRVQQPLAKLQPHPAQHEQANGQRQQNDDIHIRDDLGAGPLIVIETDVNG